MDQVHRRCARGRVGLRDRPRSADATQQRCRLTLVAASAGFERDRLGRYQVEGLLGQGAVGVVLLGRDMRSGRQAAIKALPLASELSGGELREAQQRFFREAEIAQRLHHPDIVAIYEAGEDDGWAYLAMEYVAGHDLQRHTQPAQLLPVAEVLRIGSRVARALAHAHRQGVVHRDVKPANVLVDLPADIVKVTDFGIAHLTDACRTWTGMVLGTPAYMAPEQLTGQPVDGRTDLYSLGVTLFQLLTGSLPHRAASTSALLYAIVNEVVPDVRTWRPELPAALAAALAQALAKSPEHRPADGMQLATTLDTAALP